MNSVDTGVGCETLLVLGASARAAACSAVRAGLRVVAADLFADADLLARCPATAVSDYPQGFLAMVGQAPAGPWMYTGALENSPELVATLAARRLLWGTSAPALRALREPWEVVERLRIAGLPWLPVASDPGMLPGDGSWLIKPRCSAGGTGVLAWRGAWPAPAVNPGAWYFQRRQAGWPAAAVYCAGPCGVRLWGLTRQLVGTPWLGATGFRYAGSIGPLPLSGALAKQLEALGPALACDGLLGLFGVDGVVSDETFWPVEINPRYTASMEILERATGVSAVGWHRDACLRSTWDNEPRSRQLLQAGTHGTHGKAILFARRSMVISPALAASWLDEALGNEPATLADVPVAGSVLRAGWPILTCLACGDSVAEVEHTLAARARRVEQAVDQLATVET